MEEVTFELNQQVKEEMDGTCGIESGCEGKEKGISSRGTKYANMWNRACVTFGHDSLWLEVSTGREWWEIGLDGAHIHTLAHIFKAVGQKRLRLLYNESFALESFVLYSV